MPAEPTEPWCSYREGTKDAAGRDIEAILARDPAFVIYTTKSQDNVIDPTGAPVFDYHIDGNDVARSRLAGANVLVAKIHSLAPKNSRFRVVIDKQLAGAYELALRDQIEKCNTILQDVLAQLEATRTAKGQLWYMMGNVVGCALVWIGYLLWRWRQFHGADDLTIGRFVLAGALGTLGGVLSVAINLKTIQINAHQSWLIQAFAGWTRNVVAFLGGIVCLLAIRGRIVLHLASAPETGNLFAEALVVSEAFFCFLAGFSESLVPNILRDSEQQAMSKNKNDLVADQSAAATAQAEAKKAHAVSDDAGRNADEARTAADAAKASAIAKRAVAAQARTAAAEHAALQAEEVQRTAEEDAAKAAEISKSKKEIADRLSRVALGGSKD